MIKRLLTAASIFTVIFALVLAIAPAPVAVEAQASVPYPSITPGLAFGVPIAQGNHLDAACVENDFSVPFYVSGITPGATYTIDMAIVELESYRTSDTLPGATPPTVHQWMLNKTRQFFNNILQASTTGSTFASDLLTVRLPNIQASANGVINVAFTSNGYNLAAFNRAGGFSWIAAQRTNPLPVPAQPRRLDVQTVRQYTGTNPTNGAAVAYDVGIYFAMWPTGGSQNSTGYGFYALSCGVNVNTGVLNNRVVYSQVRYGAATG